jgi:hypothetical protein
MPNYRRLLDALVRSDWSVVKEYVQDPTTDPRVKELCNAWLRHDRGRSLAMHDLKQQLHQTM